MKSMSREEGKSLISPGMIKFLLFLFLNIFWCVAKPEVAKKKYRKDKRKFLPRVC